MTDEQKIKRLERKVAILERERSILMVALSDAYGWAGNGGMTDDVRGQLLECSQLHTENDNVVGE